MYYDSFRVIYHCTLSLTERKTLTTFPSNSWTANAKLVCSSLEYVTFYDRTRNFARQQETLCKLSPFIWQVNPYQS